jgi:hypothetical protein
MPARSTSCEWHGAGWCQHGRVSTCQLEDVVPQGCPAHVLIRQGEPAPYARVIRGSQTVDALGQVTTSTVEHAVSTQIDHTCSIETRPVPVRFDQVTMTFAGVRIGERVAIPDGTVTIGKPGPCAAPRWPTDLLDSILPCDLMPCPPVARADDDMPRSQPMITLVLAIAILLAIALGWMLLR